MVRFWPFPASRDECNAGLVLQRKNRAAYGQEQTVTKRLACADSARALGRKPLGAGSHEVDEELFSGSMATFDGSAAR